MHLPDRQNAQILLFLRTCFEIKLPVTVYLDSVQDAGLFSRMRVVFYGDEAHYESIPQHEYTDLDLVLAAAYQYYLNNLCGRCGSPSWYGRSDHSGVEFELATTTCYSCAAIDAKQDEKDYKRGHGETLFATPHGTRYDDGTEDPLPPPEEAAKKIN